MHELEKSPYSHGLRDEAKVEFTWGSGLTHLPCVPEADLRVSGGSSASANVLGESPPQVFMDHSQFTPSPGYRTSQFRKTHRLMMRTVRKKSPRSVSMDQENANDVGTPQGG